MKRKILLLAAPVILISLMLFSTLLAVFSVPRPPGPSLAVSPSQVTPGQKVQVRGTNFPRGPVSIYLDNEDPYHYLGSVSAPDSSGVISLDFTMPPSYPGTHTVLAIVPKAAGASAEFTLVYTDPLDERLIDLWKDLESKLWSDRDSVKNETHYMWTYLFAYVFSRTGPFYHTAQIDTDGAHKHIAPEDIGYYILYYLPPHDHYGQHFKVLITISVRNLDPGCRVNLGYTVGVDSMCTAEDITEDGAYTYEFSAIKFQIRSRILSGYTTDGFDVDYTYVVEHAPWGQGD